MKYVLVDGCLQRSSPATERWAHRTRKAVPVNITEAEAAEDCKKIAECDRILGVHRSDFERIQDLEEYETDKEQ